MAAYLASLITALTTGMILFLEAAVVGRGLTALLPFRARGATLFLAPALGMSVLVIAAVWAARLTPLRDVWWLPHGIAAVALLLQAPRIGTGAARWRRWATPIGYWAVFAVVTAVPALMPLMLFGIESPAGGDSFMYMSVAQWLQRQAFLETPGLSFAFQPEYSPSAALMLSWQWLDSKIGGQSLIGLVQAAMGAEWSFDVYCPAVGAMVAMAGATVGGAVFLITGRRGVAVAAALVLVLTSNAFSWAALAGFMPQTLGVPFLIAALTILTGGHARTSGSAWRPAATAALAGIPLAALVYAYNDILPLTLGLLGLVFLLTWRRAGFKAAVLGCVPAVLMAVLLANVELGRIFRIQGSLLMFASGGAVGWHINYNPWEFLSAAFGLRPFLDEFADSRGFSVVRNGDFQAVQGILLAGMAVLLSAGLAAARHLPRRRWEMVAIFAAAAAVLLGVMFPVARWVVPAPWPQATGQTFLQLRIGTWAAAFCLILVFVSVDRLGVRCRNFRPIASAFAAVWIVVGVAAWAATVQARLEPFFRDTGGAGFSALREVRDALAEIPPEQPVYLDLPRTGASWFYLQYALADRRLVGQWIDWRPPPWRWQPYAELSGSTRLEYRTSARWRVRFAEGRFLVEPFAGEVGFP
jgi:hypothetical protein